MRRIAPTEVWEHLWGETTKKKRVLSMLFNRRLDSLYCALPLFIAKATKLE